MRSLLNKLKGTCLHPQWLSDRYHTQSRRLLANILSGRVIDIGSGDSNHSSYIASGVDLLRFDYPDTHCRYNSPPHVFADAAQLPLADSSADAVLLLEVLEHVEQFEQVLAEIQRILKADGELYLSAPFIYPAHDVPYDFHRFTRHGLVKDLARHGLNVVTIKQHGNSFVVALQMLNLSLLEQVKKTMDCSSVMGLLLAIFCYPLCITINLLALLLLGLNNSNAAVFGHFVVARPVRPQCESN